MVVCIHRDAEHGTATFRHADAVQVRQRVGQETLAPAVGAGSSLGCSRGDAVQRVVNKGLRAAGICIVGEVVTVPLSPPVKL